MTSQKRDLIKEAASVAKNLQVAEIKRLGEAWLKFDLNGDGIVKTNEIFKVLSNLSINIPDGDINKIIDELDRNRSGTIEFIEFIRGYDNGLFDSFIKK